MKNRLHVPALLVALTLLASQAWSQQLIIQPEPGKQVVLTQSDIEALPHIKLTIAVSGTPTTFQGVALNAILERGGIVFGETLKGKRLASCLLVEAADGYRVVFALPELDPAFTDKQIVLAYLKDGKPLDDKEGPYRIVIPDEKRMARWVRQVTKLRIVEPQ